MLEGVSAAQGRMAGRIGDDQPGRAGWKFPKALSAALLKLLIRFEEVVKAEHEIIIIGSGLSVRAKDAEHPLLQTAGPAGRVTSRQPDLVAKALQQLGKRIRGDPN